MSAARFYATPSPQRVVNCGVKKFCRMDQVLTLRSAGSGFAQSWNLGGVFGCRLSAARGGTVILPRTATAFPVPFAGFLGGAGATKSGNLRVAPLLIAKNQSEVDRNFQRREQRTRSLRDQYQHLR